MGTFWEFPPLVLTMSFPSFSVCFWKPNASGQNTLADENKSKKYSLDLLSGHGRELRQSSKKGLQVKICYTGLIDYTVLRKKGATYRVWLDSFRGRRPGGKAVPCAACVNNVQTEKEGECLLAGFLTLGTAPTRMLLMREHSRTWPSCTTGTDAKKCKCEHFYQNASRQIASSYSLH